MTKIRNHWIYIYIYTFTSTGCLNQSARISLKPNLQYRGIFSINHVRD